MGLLDWDYTVAGDKLTETIYLFSDYQYGYLTESVPIQTGMTYMVKVRASSEATEETKESEEVEVLAFEKQPEFTIKSFEVREDGVLVMYVDDIAEQDDWVIKFEDVALDW